VQLRQSNLSSKLHSHKEETAVALTFQVGGAQSGRKMPGGWCQSGTIKPKCWKNGVKEFFLADCQIRGVFPESRTHNGSELSLSHSLNALMPNYKFRI